MPDKIYPNQEVSELCISIFRRAVAGGADPLETIDKLAASLRLVADSLLEELRPSIQGTMEETVP